MGIHLYVIESLTPDSPVGVEWLSIDARAYLQVLGISGFREFKQPTTPDAIKNEVDDFFSWCENIPEEDWVVLLLSMHAQPPDAQNHVATSAVSSHGLEDVEWYKVFESAKWRQRTIVITDICWGATPTLVRLGPKAGTPDFVFGPTRPAGRLELNAAASLLIGRLGQDKDLRLESATQIVDFLNSTFSPNSDIGTDYYRVWWWADGRHKPNRHPTG